MVRLHARCLGVCFAMLSSAVLAAEGSISGYLVDEAGEKKAIEHVVVFVADAKTGYPLLQDSQNTLSPGLDASLQKGLPGFRHLMTSEDGSFLLKNVPAGEWRLVAQEWIGADHVPMQQEEDRILQLHGVVNHVVVRDDEVTEVTIQPLGDKPLVLENDPMEGNTYGDFNLYPDFLIEHVPGLYDSSASYPFEGIAVRPWQSDLSAPVTPPAFTPRGAYHNGATGYRSAAMTGVPAASQGMISMWYRSADTAWNASTRTLFSFRVGANMRLEAKTSSTGRITITLVNDTGANSIICYAGPGSLQHATGQWYHLLMDWTATAAAVWINGNAVGSKSYAALTMAGSNLSQMGIGTTSTGSQYWLGSLARVWISPTQRLDFAVQANREKFALAGVPVDLGANGQLPTGAAPEWYYDGDAPAWANQGMAGSVALDGGPLTPAPAPPPGY